jgi:LPXTG-motif cell wall-anchored protein
LAFTGTNAIDLAVVGATAAVVGRGMYGLAKRRRDEDDDVPDDE